MHPFTSLPRLRSAVRRSLITSHFLLLACLLALPAQAALPNTPPTLDPLTSQTTAEDTALIVGLTVGDAESDLNTLTLTANSSNPALLPPTHILFAGSGANRSATLTPIANQSGTTVITITVSDGALITSAAFTLTVSPINDAPTLAPLPAQTVPESLARGPIPLVLKDDDTAPGSLILSGNSSNPGLLPVGNLTFGGGGVNRTLTLTPTAELTGNATLTITVSDGLSQTTQAFLVTVTPANDAPTAVGLTNATIAENQPSGSLVGTFTATDPDAGNTHTYSLVTGAGDKDNALFVVVGNVLRTNAVFDYETRNTYTLRARATDSGNLWVEQTLTVTLTNANDTPTAQADFAATIIDQAVSLPVLANDLDPDNNVLTLSNVSPPLSGTTDILNNRLVYTPATLFVGTETFTYTLSDGQGGTSNAWVTILVNSELTDVVALSPDVVTTTQGIAVPISVLHNDLAPTALSLLYAGPTNGGQTTISDTQILFTPYPNVTGIVTFTYAALADTLGSSTTVTVNILPLNAPPWAADDSATTPEQTAITLNVLANDSDAENNPLTLISLGQGLHGWVMPLGGGGLVRYTPAAGFVGVDYFTYSITDGQDGIATAVAAMQVGPVPQRPKAMPDSALADEDTPRVLNVLANDLNPNPNGLLQVVQISQAQSGTVTLLSNGSVQYVPHANYAGPDEFAYTARDSFGFETTASVSLTVRPVTDAPRPNPVFGTTPLDTPLTLNPQTHAANPEGRPLYITHLTTPNSGTVSLNPDGTVLYTPTLGFVGFDQFAYSLSFTNTPTVNDPTAWVTLAVGNVPPTAQTANAAFNVMAGQSQTLAPLDNAQCPATPTGTGALRLAGLQVSAGIAAAQANGSISYTPAPGFSGAATLTYTASDDQNCWGQGVLLLTIWPAQRPPNAVEDVLTSTEDLASVFTLTTNDYDLSGEPFTVTAVSTAANGQVTLNANGTVRYTPTLNFVGTDAFAYTVVNGQDAADMAVVTLNIVNTPDAPRPQDDWAYTHEETPLFIAVLANDADPDGNALTVQPGQPQHGTATTTPLGAIRYNPLLNFTGLDVFTYTVNDGLGGLAQATVTVTVVNTNDAPVAVADVATVPLNSSLSIAVLANDTDIDANTQLRLVSVQNNGVLGMAEAQGTNVFYTAGSTNGVETLTYVVADEHGAQATGNLIISITPLADFSPRALTVTAGAVVTFTNLSTGIAPLSYTWAFGDGSVSAAQHPTHTYASPGSYTVTLTVLSAGGPAMTTGQITVLAPILAPIADFNPRHLTTTAGAAITFTNLSTGSAPLSYTWAFGDGDVSAAQHPTHTYALPGNYTVTLVALNVGGVATATGHITVTLAGVAPLANFSPRAITITPGTLLTFTNLSTGTLPLTYAWSFGDSGVSLLQHPAHLYALPGTYTVTLTTTNAFGQHVVTGTVTVLWHRVYLPLIRR